MTSEKFDLFPLDEADTVVEGNTPNPDDFDSPETKLRKEKIAGIKERISKVKVAKKVTADILGWGDVILEDRRIIEKNNALIAQETPIILTEVDGLFKEIIQEVEKLGEVKSSSRTYTAKYIVDMILKLKQQAEAGEEPDLDYITSANNLRNRVSELLNLIKDFNS